LLSPNHKRNQRGKSKGGGASRKKSEQPIAIRLQFRTRKEVRAKLSGDVQGKKDDNRRKGGKCLKPRIGGTEKSGRDTLTKPWKKKEQPGPEKTKTKELKRETKKKKMTEKKKEEAIEDSEIQK